MKNNRGFAQIPLMIALLLMAVAIPAVTQLIQNSTENRSQAAKGKKSDYDLKQERNEASKLDKKADQAEKRAADNPNSASAQRQAEEARKAADEAAKSAHESELAATIAARPTVNPAVAAAAAATQAAAKPSPNIVCAYEGSGAEGVVCRDVSTPQQTRVYVPGSSTENRPEDIWVEKNEKGEWEINKKKSSYYDYGNASQVGDKCSNGNTFTAAYGCNTAYVSAAPTAKTPTSAKPTEILVRQTGDCPAGFHKGSCSYGYCKCESNDLCAAACTNPSSYTCATCMANPNANKKCCCTGGVGDECGYADSCPGNTQVDGSVCDKLAKVTIYPTAKPMPTDKPMPTSAPCSKGGYNCIGGDSFMCEGSTGQMMNTRSEDCHGLGCGADGMCNTTAGCRSDAECHGGKCMPDGKCGAFPTYVQNTGVPTISLPQGTCICTADHILEGTCAGRWTQCSTPGVTTTAGECQADWQCHGGKCENGRCGAFPTYVRTTTTPVATAKPSGGYVPPVNPTAKPTTKPGGPGPGEPTCKEECPGSDGVLRNCTPPESDGTSADSICGVAGRVELCGGQQFCCPTAGGTWTKDMTKCPTVGTAPILKFRMAFSGIITSAQCATAEKLPLSVMVRNNDGTLKTFTSVQSVRVNNTGTLAYYDVTLRLNDFKVTGPFSVFVKGPKHLQMKYGINNQDKYYDKAGGELSGLTTDVNTTPLFHFEKYPLLAGDVTGPNGTQDGAVNGLDFTYVKNESVKRTEVAAGGYMLADLNGNCKMESSDLTLLMLSLSVKQGQLY